VTQIVVGIHTMNLLIAIYFPLSRDHSTDLFATFQLREESKALTNKPRGNLKRYIKGTKQDLSISLKHVELIPTNSVRKSKPREIV
jgi:hypothetical protein